MKSGRAGHARSSRRALGTNVAERTASLAATNEKLRKEIDDRKRAEHALRASEINQNPPIVFVADDDISVRESLELLLRHEGLGIETFVSAREFLNHPRSTAPSCLILDLSLPVSTVSS